MQPRTFLEYALRNGARTASSNGFFSNLGVRVIFSVTSPQLILQAREPSSVMVDRFSGRAVREVRDLSHV